MLADALDRGDADDLLRLDATDQGVFLDVFQLDHAGLRERRTLDALKGASLTGPPPNSSAL
ncbi:hypothetical protein D3C80_1826750 [compost metagenome]